MASFGFTTVTQAIEQVGLHHPEGDFIFQDMKGVETRRRFADLPEVTAPRCAALQSMGLTKGDRVGLIVVEPEDLYSRFSLACGSALSVRSTRPCHLGSWTRTSTAPRTCSRRPVPKRSSRPTRCKRSCGRWSTGFPHSSASSLRTSSASSVGRRSTPRSAPMTSRFSSTRRAPHPTPKASWCHIAA